MVSLLAEGGAHPGNHAYNWIRKELSKLGVTTFADLRLNDRGADSNLRPNQRYKLVVIATDITQGRLLRLPWDYELFDRDPDKELVADAVLASMSIPLCFSLRTHWRALPPARRGFLARLLHRIWTRWLRSSVV